MGTLVGLALFIGLRDEGKIEGIKVESADGMTVE